MENRWKEAFFSELCDITRGASPRPIQEWITKNGVPWVKISDATTAGSRYITRTKECIRSEGRSKSVVVAPGDLILSNSATPGIPMFMDIEACIHDGWLLLRSFRGLDKLFAYYLLLNERPALVQQGNGSVFTNLKTEILKKHLVRVPSLSEQRAIASILGSLDDKIELNRRMNETLEALAQALFKSWFVDFDPVRAKMEGRQPAGMDDETAALFPDSFEDSTIGEIPKGWSADALSNVVEVNPRRALPKGQSAPHLDMKSMPTKGHYPAELTERDFGSGTKFIKGDTLLARITPCLENGKTAFVDFLDDGQVGWGSTEYIVLRPKPPLPTEYAYYLARSEPLRTYAIQNMVGSSGRQRVPAQCLDSYFVAVPTEDVALCFGDTAAQLMDKIRANHEQSAILAATRDALLPKLLSGEVRVGEAEEVVEDIV